MPAYATLVIPSPLSSESVTLLAHKLRAFKLHALLSDPNAFSQSHTTESQLPVSAWEARVANPEFRTVVCIVDDLDERDIRSREGVPNDEGPSSPEVELNRQIATVQRLLAAEWAGTFTLVGPVAREAWLCPSSGQPVPAADGAETRWHLTSLFVLPEHRGCGIAGKLTLAAVRAGVEASAAPPLLRPEGLESSQEADGGTKKAPTRFRLIVHPKNKGVVGLYEKLGFVVGGLYTQREAIAAMGDKAGIPAGITDTRSAIGMECLV